MLSKTEFGVIISMCFFHVYECESSSGWQSCNDKCYFLGTNKMDFESQKGYCNTMSGSDPVDFGSKMAQSIATYFLPCRLSKKDYEPYWINKQSILCRTIKFHGDNVIMNQNENCSSTVYPICEKDKSFCTASNDSQELKHTWVRVAGQGPYFMLTRGLYPYCDAKDTCKYSLRGKIMPGGNYTFMGLLGKELGISGQRNVEFWLDSPGVLCPTRQDVGTIMQYTGPYVHLTANRSVQLPFSVLCMSDHPLDIVNLTQLSSQQKHSSSTSTQEPTTLTTQQIHTSSTSTKAPTFSTTQQTLTSSTSTKVPTTSATQHTHSSSTSTKVPTTSTTQHTHSSSTSTNVPTTSTTKQTHKSSTSIKVPTTSTTQQTHTTSTSTKTPTTSTLKQTNTSSTSTQAPKNISTQQTHSLSTSTKAPTTSKTQQTDSSSTSTRTATTNRAQQILTSSTCSEAPKTKEWVQIGQEEYYVNTVPLDFIKASQYCGEKMNASLAMFLDPLNYFSVLGQIKQIASQERSYWVGAFGLEETGLPTDGCLSYNNNNNNNNNITLATLSCHTKTFSVCRRLLNGNMSQVLENPEFMTMIREMTVLKNGTKRHIRKLTCAKDERRSSEAAGGVGVFIICSVIVVMLMSDCSGIKSSFFNKKDKLR